MTAQGTPTQRRDRSGIGISRALHLVLRLLAVAVFTQAVFAGLFLDGKGSWLAWHEANASLIQLLALVQALLAVGVWAILGLTGTLLGRTRTLIR